MIVEEYLNKLYSGVIKGEELTTKQLKEYGFNSKDLNELIETGRIERVKKGLYSFKLIDELYFYGKKLISQMEYDKATACFEKCHELDPTHPGACFQLFLRSVQKEDYTRAFELYEVLSHTDNKYYNNDNNYYLYLLSIITDIPQKYREYARYLKYDDIKIQDTDKRYQDIILQNKVRIAVLQRKFPYAKKQLRDLIEKHRNLSLQDLIAKTLLIKAAAAENLSKSTVVSLIKDKKYEEVTKYLLNKQKRHNLSVLEEYVLKLTYKYNEIKETAKIPKIVSLIKCDTLFRAIDANNFISALELCTKYNAENNISNDTNAINLLLNDICNLIKDLREETSIKEVIKEEQLPLDPKSKIDKKEFNIESEISFSSILANLLKNDFDNAYICLKKYMASLEKSQYEFLIIDLIKLSVVEKDIAFTKPMLTLTLICKDSYKFDLSNYIQEFYITLSQNRFQEARLYLDIISNANKLGQDCIITDSLYKVLEFTEKTLSSKGNITVLETSEETVENEKAKESESNKTVEIPKATIESAKETISNSTIAEEEIQDYEDDDIEANVINEEIYADRKFLDAKHEKLVLQKGIILLNPMDDDRIRRILDIAEEYIDMVAFVIGSENNKQVVLRYKPIIEEYVDHTNLINIGNQAYSDGNYDECIKYYLQLLQLFDTPRAITYAKLGLSFMKKKNSRLAIDYLTVATDLAKKEKKNIDYSSLLLSLKGDISKDDLKPKVNMSLKDFNYNDVNDFYGIENFDVINSFITSSGLDVESACEQMGLNAEQINIIKLIYAREFYMQGDIVRGDLFLRSVERSKNKTKTTIRIFNEIKKNKKFYQNRRGEEPRQLVLSLLPQKK